MQVGMIGLGRMGSNMVRRLLARGHWCVVHDVHSETMAELERHGASAAVTLEEMVTRLARPRAVWMMLPAAIVDRELEKLAAALEPGDIVIDGGNSYYHDDIRRGAELKQRGLHYVDVGTSGGVFGLERGYCLMIGGETDIVAHLSPLFAALAPGVGAAAPTPGRQAGDSAEQGFLHCGPQGAGHFVKMVHNGIEYGIMAAYAEGFNLLKGAAAGNQQRSADAETAPLRHPEYYRYELDVAAIAEVWRRGSVIASWLLDLTAAALQEDPQLQGFAGRVSDSGEGRWTIAAALDAGVPLPVISAALFERFASRGGADFADRLLSAMRKQFGGHHETNQDQAGGAG